jgi:hypothetical protein
MRRISRGEIRGKKMEILIGAEVEMRRISCLHAWLGDYQSIDAHSCRHAAYVADIRPTRFVEHASQYQFNLGIYANYQGQYQKTTARIAYLSPLINTLASTWRDDAKT